jgi:hypothetical protein
MQNLGTHARTFHWAVRALYLLSNASSAGVLLIIAAASEMRTDSSLQLPKEALQWACNCVRFQGCRPCLTLVLAGTLIGALHLCMAHVALTG